MVNAVEWVALESSVFTSAAYRADARQLYLRFHEGSIYRYFECPGSVYKALLAAGSKGGYFARHIRNGFRCERVHGEDQEGSRAARDSRDFCITEQLRNSILLAKARVLRKPNAAQAAAVQP
jgi:KTSC domain